MCPESEASGKTLWRPLSGFGSQQESCLGLFLVMLIDSVLVRICLVPAVMLKLKRGNQHGCGRLQRLGRAEKSRKH